MKVYALLISFFALAACSGSDDEPIVPTVPTPERTYYRGMDLSFQSELESYDPVYRDAAGATVNLLDFVESAGTNLVRLKLWHTSEDGQNTLAQVLAYAQKIKQHNMAFMLDIHYSDTWADPSHQTPPAAWQGLTQEQLQTEVFDYTKSVLTAFKNQGTAPAFVQIGNETDSGFLWDYGRVWDAFDDNWPNYAALVSKAIDAVREVNGNDTKVILHHSKVENAVYFFTELQPFALDFDVIGLSYYPQFQTKNLITVQTKLNELAATFDKEIMIVEVAYPFTFEWDDNLTNYIGSADQIIGAYPATPQGQRDFMGRIDNIVKSIPNDKGIGWVYWAPDWVAFDGNETTTTGGSSWENQALWDFDHKALPAMGVFTP
ncbi:glycoside hydrolase family 53 protein [Flavobacterium caeni]|uniref:Arabinogalactan endo-beta-1,4-galactanase n=1 Tax=Flavobacterium caeni TaxID=490189 RepID=A0A1G5FTH9_9FLAO|nr:glycosyl hydrolase 53 family protein [Flavobacterium caeni]SCY41888.1 arabinogalactan endo-1,4-beta-galactosidase [Flavobacterium caeni]